jgi:hypothetical protein
MWGQIQKRSLNYGFVYQKLQYPPSLYEILLASYNKDYRRFLRDYKISYSKPPAKQVGWDRYNGYI